MIKTITARELQEKISKKKLHLLDVREKVEYAMGHVPTAVNLPLSEFVSSYQTLDKDKVYHIICQSGSRSEQAAVLRLKDILQLANNIVNVAGGTSAWTGVLEY